MIDTDATGLIVLFVVFSRAEINEGKTMVLVVLGEECQPVVTMLYLRFKHPFVPGDHLLVTTGIIDNVGEFTWSYHYPSPIDQAILNIAVN